MLQVAIVGAGAVAPAHVEAYGKYPELCRVAAICDQNVQRAQELIESTDLDAQAYGSLREVLNQQHIDAISICLPQGLHAETAIAALQSGKHVLVEKPMAASLEECDRMIEAQKESGKILSVISQNRYKIPTMKVKKMLEQKTGGPVRHATVNSLWWRGDSYFNLRWRGVWEREGGGCFTTHAVHHLDVMQWMLGMPQAVTAVISNVAHENSECEDSGVAIFEYPTHLAQFTCNLVTHEEEQEMIFQTESGRMAIPWRTAASKELPNGFPVQDTEAIGKLDAQYNAIPELAEEGHTAQIGNFIKALSGMEPLMIDGPEGRKAVELITGIYKAAVTGTRVEFPISAQDVFYCKDEMIGQMPRFHEKTHWEEHAKVLPISFGRDVGR